MKCPWCDNKPDVKELNKKNVSHHLIVTVNSKNHFHIHAPFEDASIFKQMLNFLVEEANKNGFKFTLSDTVGYSNNQEGWSKS